MPFFSEVFHDPQTLKPTGFSSTRHLASLANVNKALHFILFFHWQEKGE